MPEIGNNDPNIRILKAISPKEQQVIFGTQQEPLVIERIFDNGKHEKVRIVNPERSQQIPTFVFWDTTVTQEQQSVIKEAFHELFEAAHLDSSQLSFFGNWHEEIYKDDKGILLPNKSIEWQLQSKLNRDRHQINAGEVAYTMFFDPYQTTNPHWEAIFTNMDLYDARVRFLIGCAYPDLGTVISLGRLEQISDPGLRGETQKTEIFHEFGHVLNLPSERRGRHLLEQSLGGHCKNNGCSMKQGLSVPTDWIEYTKARIRSHQGPYCADCKQDLAQKFHT